MWYQFSTSRGAEQPSQHLATYEGFAHADAYAGYNDAYRTGRVKEMACIADVRREFFLKWSGKFGQRAKMYPTRTNGCENDKATELFKPV